MRDRAPRRRRLSRSAEFERVYRQGRSKGNRFLVLYAFPREDESRADPSEGPRLGLSVSKRIGGAVDRNRVKRVLREAFWEEAARLPSGSDYVVVARPDARGLAEREGMSGVRTALAELVDGLGGAPAPRKARREGARDRADPRLPALDLARLPAPLQVPPDVLGVRGAGGPALWHPQRYGARGLAHPALQSVQPRRL